MAAGGGGGVVEKFTVRRLQYFVDIVAITVLSAGAEKLTVV